MKTLNNSNVNQAKKQVEDLEVYGDGDQWKLLTKASSEEEGWMKSTKVLEVRGKAGRSGGCLVQVTTQQRDSNGGYALAEAIAFVPGVRHLDFDFPKSMC